MAQDYLAHTQLLPQRFRKPDIAAAGRATCVIPLLLLPEPCNSIETVTHCLVSRWKAMDYLASGGNSIHARSCCPKYRAMRGFRVLDAALQGRIWLVGGFTAADIMIGSVVDFLNSLGQLDAEKLPQLAAYLQRIRQRPFHRVVYGGSNDCPV